MNKRPCKSASLCLFLVFLFIFVAFMLALNAYWPHILAGDSTDYRVPDKDFSYEQQQKLIATAALKARLQCNDRPLQTERAQHGDYWVVRNLISGSVSRNVGCAETITYTTHGEYTFFGNLPTLVKRWRAPISIAVFTPGRDLSTTLSAMQYLRNCIDEQLLIRQYVSLHVFFPTAHLPPTLPLNESAALAWPYNCRWEDVPLYRHEHRLTYPINVARNVARKSANTHFVFASDIELYPSPGLVSQFLEMVTKQPDLIGDNQRHVFPLAVFELKTGVSLPETKKDLVQLLQAKKAVPFHFYICQNCHQVPEEDNWIKAADQQELRVFASAKREDDFQHWEPFYISDNSEPLFDERVTWEGRSDKRIQNYAMCLLGYEYRVLHPAFLVHAPGIKLPVADERKIDHLMKHIIPTNRLISKVIRPEYKILYGENEACIV